MESKMIVNQKNKIKFYFIVIFIIINTKQIFSTPSYSLDTAINGISYNDEDYIEKILNISSDSFYSINYKTDIYWGKLNPLLINTYFNPIFFIFKNTYIMMSPELDGGKYFELGYTSNSVLKRRHHKMKQNAKFITNNGVYLGMKEKEFNTKMGPPPWGKFYTMRVNINIRKKFFNIYYHQIIGGGVYYSWYANIEDRPSYIARYIFENGRLVKFGFGRMPMHPTHDFEDIL